MPRTLKVIFVALGAAIFMMGVLLGDNLLSVMMQVVIGAALLATVIYSTWPKIVPPAGEILERRRRDGAISIGLHITLMVFAAFLPADGHARALLCITAILGFSAAFERLDRLNGTDSMRLRDIASAVCGFRNFEFSVATEAVVVPAARS